MPLAVQLGALPLEEGKLLGAIGVSGDTSCADHNIAWKTRDFLALDLVPDGVSAPGDDNIVYDPTDPFGHPDCGFGGVAIGVNLPITNPIGP